MLVLFETAAGYALFKVLNESKLKQVDNLYKEFEDVGTTEKIIKLQKFNRFKNTADALKATTSLLDGKISKALKKFLSKEIVDKKITDQLAVGDAKLGGLIKEKLGIQCIHTHAIDELNRGIRSQINSLIGDVTDSDMKAMSLGLSHSLSRYKLKFSPEKVDTMIIQAIALLDDLDKELNTYAMRVREWYGWHFPELGKVIPDNILYAKTILKMGIRTNAAETDFSDILPEDLEQELKEAEKISMGTEVSEEDILNIRSLAEQVIAISEYREQLFEYLKNRMQAIAPNLTIMVGELVGARLIAHAGSLLNLAKHPASTIQILGAEKALFRALKTKHETPKYGLIYHASLIGQAPMKLKGKISRVLAAKTSLAVRYDSFGEGETGNDIGIESRAKVEARLKSLESGVTHRISGSGKGKSNTPKYDSKVGTGNQMRTPVSYNSKADSTIGKSPKAKQLEEVEQPTNNGDEMEVESTTPSKRDKKEKKNKKEKRKNGESNGNGKEKAEEELVQEESKTPSKKDKKEKSKKRKVEEPTEEVDVDVSDKKKKKTKKNKSNE